MSDPRATCPYCGQAVVPSANALRAHNDDCIPERRIQAVRERIDRAAADQRTWLTESIADLRNDRRVLLAAFDAVREAVETEWYNGNVDEGARDRILSQHG